MQLRGPACHPCEQVLLQRVLNSGLADPDKIQELVALYTTASPLTLKRQIDRRLAAMPAALGVFHSA